MLLRLSLHKSELDEDILEESWLRLAGHASGYRAVVAARLVCASSCDSRGYVLARRIRVSGEFPCAIHCALRRHVRAGASCSCSSCVCDFDAIAHFEVDRVHDGAGAADSTERGSRSAVANEAAACGAAAAPVDPIAAALAEACLLAFFFFFCLRSATVCCCGFAESPLQCLPFLIRQPMLLYLRPEIFAELSFTCKERPTSCRRMESWVRTRCRQRGTERIDYPEAAPYRDQIELQPI